MRGFVCVFESACVSESVSERVYVCVCVCVKEKGREMSMCECVVCE